jgi:fluoride exporter
LGSEPDLELHTLPIDPDVDRGDFRDLRGRRAQHLRAIGTVALGGALGTPVRYGISQLVHITPGTFPWGTFWTNVSGSFALGVVLSLLIERFRARSRHLRLFMATGFLGAYTTYSTFAVETTLLVKNGHAAIAGAYAAATLLIGLAAVSSGLFVARIGWKR